MPEFEKSDAIPEDQAVSADQTNSLPEAGTQWFALSVKPRFEKAAARTLEMKGFKTFLPLYRKQHIYAERCKESELPLFPGYVFCRFSPLTRMPILTTPGVVRILGNGNWPTAMSETEIASLQTAIKAKLPLQPFPFLQIGEKVRIEEGVLAGVEGVVIRLKQSLRLVLSITLLQRSVQLEVDRDQVSVARVLQPVSENAPQDTHAGLSPSSS